MKVTVVKLTSFLAALTAAAHHLNRRGRCRDEYSPAEIAAMVKFYMRVPDVRDLAKRLGRTEQSIYHKAMELRQSGELDAPASMQHGRRPVRFIGWAALLLIPMGKALALVAR